MSNLDYDRIVIGATMLGVGLALARPQRTLLVEASAGAGTDFVTAMRAGTGVAGWQAPVAGGLAASLHQELLERNILDPATGGLHLPAVGPVLCRRLQAAAVETLFLTDVLSVQAAPGEGARIELAHKTGRQTLTAREIIDTTARPHAAKGPLRVGLRRRAIAAALNRRDAAAPGPATLGCAIPGTDALWSPGCFAAEAWLEVPIAAAADWAAARQALHSFWLSRPALLAGWDLASIAAELIEVPVAATPATTCRWLPSAAHPNLLAAFAAGTV